LRALHAGMVAGEVGLAASTGTSTAAMLACCAHHVSDVLPFLGVSGAAVFLGANKTPLLWVGLAMNLAGIAYLLCPHALSHTPSLHEATRSILWSVGIPERYCDWLGAALIGSLFPV
jgi:hypothetical protein